MDDDSAFFGRPTNPDNFPMVIQCESCGKELEVSIGEVTQHAGEHRWAGAGAYAVAQRVYGWHVQDLKSALCVNCTAEMQPDA